MLLLQNITKEFLSWTKKRKYLNKFEFYNESGLQFEMLFFLRNKIERKYKIYAEKNISSINQKIKKKRFNKKEMDIYIEGFVGDKYCIEIKYLTGNAIPRRMSQIYEDVKFLEQLKTKLHFKKVLSFVITPQKVFWKGSHEKGLSSVFRNPNGIIVLRRLGRNELPKFLRKDNNRFKTQKEYQTKWQDYGDNKHKYFSIEI